MTGTPARGRALGCRVVPMATLPPRTRGRTVAPTGMNVPRNGLLLAGALGALAASLVGAIVIVFPAVGGGSEPELLTLALCAIPILEAAAKERSITRPWRNGPRSLTRTTTLLPLATLVTRA